MMYDELIKELREYWNDGTEDLRNQAADAIVELEQENEKLRNDLGKAIRILTTKRWIPVTERLPEQDGTFITAYSKGGVSQNWYMVFHHGGGKWYQNSEDTGEVTHWMPLPQPPESEET